MASSKKSATGGGVSNPPSGTKLSVKQEREQRRQTKVEAFKKERKRAKRNRLIAIVLSIVAGVAVLSVIGTFVVLSSQPKPDPAKIELTGVKTWDVPGAVHVDPKTVDYKAEYGMDPPAGGPHWGAWLNCGVYNQPQQNERATHALEHGAIWVTYNADKVTGPDLSTLISRLPSSYVVVSPYPGLDAPAVASAWGAQIRLKDVNDPRLDAFVAKYWKAGNAPELGASCSGAVDGPGKVG